MKALSMGVMAQHVAFRKRSSSEIILIKVFERLHFSGQIYIPTFW